MAPKGVADSATFDANLRVTKARFTWTNFGYKFFDLLYLYGSTNSHTLTVEDQTLVERTDDDAGLVGTRALVRRHVLGHDNRETEQLAHGERVVRTTAEGRRTGANQVGRR